MPTQAILDVGVREPGLVKEVHCCDANGVAGPREELLMSGWYVKDLVGYMPEEGRDLFGHDLVV